MVFFGVGLLITVVIAAVVSQFASTQPDSLMYVAEQGGFVNTAEAHALDYSRGAKVSEIDQTAAPQVFYSIPSIVMLGISFGQ